MKHRPYRIEAKVWLYPGDTPWHFVTIPKKESMEIKDKFSHVKRGWGSLPVKVTTGDTSWKTSIFPESKEGAYILPMKAEVRKKEQIKVGDSISLTLEIEA